MTSTWLTTAKLAIVLAVEPFALILVSQSFPAGHAKRAGNLAKRMPGVEPVAGKLTDEELDFIVRQGGGRVEADTAGTTLIPRGHNSHIMV